MATMERKKNANATENILNFLLILEVVLTFQKQIENLFKRV